MEFPILGTRFTIPWKAIASHENQALSNHGQTLKRLAERGGLDWVEALAVMEDRTWIRLDSEVARKKVLSIVSNQENNMDIDEAIQHCKEKAIENNCNQCGKDHEQLAKWLTELKEYRDIGSTVYFRKLRDKGLYGIHLN
ncbi:hypothetical protein [Lacrimispora sp.]|uniref:hypothetical protein n=1 Tax=Lacrimispora sp. TaxID=2719234 RepID=UPI00345FB8FC